MATINSTQVANVLSNPVTKLGATDLGGRLRVAFFTAVTPASGNNIGDIIQLCYIPKGARLIKGTFAWDTAQGASATTAIGISGTAGKYFAAAVTNSTAQNEFLNTVALNWGSTEASPTTSANSTGAELLIATNATAAWTASSNLYGYVLYVVD
jgi:hypothetical protein